ncbi:MAG: protein-methionine-sulfoxide reductase catalytic subunit MsrP [Proteobacteria bacterium]|nr:protein-methionine-sulfoxide reductase catalytic subunit MsrP [Pseudomonadota bacterium]
MNIKIRKSWELRDQDISSEILYNQRREWLKKMGYGLALAMVAPEALLAATSGFPTALNSNYQLKGEDVSDEKLVTSYNNFYEFSFKKGDVVTKSVDFQPEPWELEITGLVHNPIKMDVNQIVKKVGTEQRIYRMRCVEAWSMVVPWDGFALNKLIKLAEPTSKAKYLKFVSFMNPKEAPGQKNSPHYPWPYTEGLRLDEAMNDLTMMATGIYGKPLPKQNGAPLRLVVPWKYGFKSIKSITRIELTDKMPDTLWNSLAPNEYGFYANVNPGVNHPRWSQKRERPVGGGWFKKSETRLFNGYGDEVAQLYKGMDLRKMY